MRMVEIIEKKRNGLSLSREEIRFFIEKYVQNFIPDYQASALTMAIYFQGMNAEETAELTMAMAESGDQVDLSSLGMTVDKHSSGGVGDKTTLIVAPLVAACGLTVAKMSGRGLGHTGGTIDKLESIPGFQVEMSQEDFLQQVKDIGIAVISQSGNLVPADKKLYALRDVTATVSSIPLIASSIMSKKIASGAKGIVLDVKYGSGAFMASAEEAEELAKTMVSIGKNLGRETVAVLSNMDQPLGKAVGNSLEVREAIDTLQGQGPADLKSLCLELAAQMLLVGKMEDTIIKARTKVEEVLGNGQALAKFLAFIQAQGGDAELAAVNRLPVSPVKGSFSADRDGIIQKIDARKLGIAAMILGAGRETKESRIDYGAGAVLLKKCGEPVIKGEELLSLYTSDPSKIQPALEILREAINIGDYPPLEKPLIYKVLD